MIENHSLAVELLEYKDTIHRLKLNDILRNYSMSIIRPIKRSTGLSKVLRFRPMLILNR
jgi:hypothetical protein